MGPAHPSAWNAKRIYFSFLFQFNKLEILVNPALVLVSRLTEP
jgi:hypothetical protein